MVDMVKTRDELLTIFEDNRFHNTPLRAKTDYINIVSSTKYSFKINFLDEKRPIDTEQFWTEYKPCKDGIILEHKERSATFLPSVMIEQGWIKNCTSDLTPNEKLYFEEQTFGHLIRKMNFYDNWTTWKKDKIHLYNSNEFNDTKNTDFQEFKKFVTKIEI